MTKNSRTVALCAAVLVGIFTHAREARADDCDQIHTQCLEDAEIFHFFCLLAFCPEGEMVSPGCSVACQALYQMDTMECESNYEQCLATQPSDSASTTCYLQCGDGSIASGACLNDEQAYCGCDGLDRGGAVEAFFTCCKLTAPTCP